MIYYPINEEIARTAKHMTSFDDYRDGSATAAYRAIVDHAAEIAEEAKRRVDPMYHGKIDALLDQYARRLAENINRENEISTRCPSILISGAGNFPVRKKEKQNAAWDACHRDRQEIEKLIDRIRSVGHGGITADDPNALDKLRAKLAAREADHERMKRINAHYRKCGTFDGCPGLTAEETSVYLAYMQRNSLNVPYPSWALSNNNAEIHRLRDRISELEKRQTAPVAVGWTFDGGRVEAETADNRLRVYFDEKPAAATRDELKSHGFKWSPKAEAWQRQLTDNAIRAARRLPCLTPITDEETAELTETATEAETAEQTAPETAELTETAPKAETAEQTAEETAEETEAVSKDQLTLADFITAAAPLAEQEPTAVPTGSTPPPLTGKYATLRDDLIAALSAGRAAEETDPEDGGTCNLDAAAVFLPRWNRALVEQAAEEAGTGCFIWNCYGQRIFVFDPDSRAQANARSRNAEAMTAALKAAGYDASNYRQMD